MAIEKGTITLDNGNDLAPATLITQVFNEDGTSYTPHEHTNLNIVEGLSEVNGVLQYKGQEIGSSNKNYIFYEEEFLTEVGQVRFNFIKGKSAFAKIDIYINGSKLSSDVIKTSDADGFELHSALDENSILIVNYIGGDAIVVPSSGVALNQRTNTQRASINNQKVFQIPLSGFKKEVHKITLNINTTTVSPSGYVINDDNTITLSEGVASGTALDFTFTWIERTTSNNDSPMSGQNISHGTITEDKFEDALRNKLQNLSGKVTISVWGRS